MPKPTSQDQPSQPPQKTEAASAKSAELEAALAQFSKILDKAVVPPAKDGESDSDKPTH